MRKHSGHKLFYSASADKTSARVGTEEEAPIRDTAMEDALEAIRRASATGFPLATLARKKPVKVSPAAVVSTAFTGKIGCRRIC